MSQEEKLPKILIVEDDERLARLTQEYLIRNGLEVGVNPMVTVPFAVLLQNNPIWWCWM